MEWSVEDRQVLAVLVQQLVQAQLQQLCQRVERLEGGRAEGGSQVREAFLSVDGLDCC